MKLSSIVVRQLAGLIQMTMTTCVLIVLLSFFILPAIAEEFDDLPQCGVSLAML